MVNEVKKRTKPCISCKLSKVKCDYTVSLPCKRCLKLGINCQYGNNSRSVPIPVPLAGTVHAQGTLPGMVPMPIPTNGMPQPQSQPQMQQPRTVPAQTMNNITTDLNLQGGNNPQIWAHSVDNRLNNFESLLETILSALYNNKIEQQTRMDQMQNEINSQATLTQNLITSQKTNRQAPIRLPNLSELEQSIDMSKRVQHTRQESPPVIAYPKYLNPLDRNGSGNGGHTDDHDVKDFRTENVITKQEAHKLLDHFVKFFGPHLYGFPFDGLNVDNLWNNSPLLLVAICTITCAHYPNLDTKFEALNSSLHWFASQLLRTPDSNMNLEHDILGLIIASLWLSQSKMFSSLAIQLARTWRIDQLYSPKLEKLWYLLYILDGTENLTSHKSPSIYKDMEPIIKDSRRSVIEKLENTSTEGQFFRKALIDYDQNTKHTATHKQLELLNEVRSEKFELNNTTLQDLRLLTQLEYHMAMESVFHNKNTHLSSLHDESLEATMTLLPTEKFGIPWTNNMDLDEWMISWTIALQNIKMQNDPWCFKSTLLYYNFARMHINTKALLQGKKSALIGDVGSSELVNLWHSQTPTNRTKVDSTELSATKEISRSSAITLLKLATKDKDLVPIFQFFPVHIYIMLYYASLVVLNPSMINEISQKEAQQGFTLVTKFKNVLEEVAISDRVLKKNLVKALSQLLQNFKLEFSANNKDSRKVYELIDHEKTTTPNEKQRPILAWPGTNPGHP